MTDRNERHFREFYTPAKQRLTALRQMQQKTPFSDDKENPDGGGLVPATIAGENAAGIGKHRRRLFTRSASKPNYNRTDNNLSNSYGNGKNDIVTENSFASPPVSTLSRALFSTDCNTTPLTHRIDENAPISPQFYSPPGSSKLLREYRSKQSLLSSSKTRTFSSPIARLRPSSLFKSKKADRIIVEEKNDSNRNPLVATAEKSQGKTGSPDDVDVITQGNIQTVPIPCLSPTATSNNSKTATTPSPNQSPMTPKTTPKRTTFWSPPGTSKLLRKYRQRTELEQDAFQSPETTLQDMHHRNQTEPRGRKALRLMESGAKRCRNHRLTLRPRPATNEVLTPTKAAIRARMKTKAKPKEASKENRSLLSPLTAKRLNKDIKEYRQALKLTSAPEEKDPPLPAEDSVTCCKEDFKELDISGDMVKTSSKQFVPALSASETGKGHELDDSANDISNDDLPFDEHDEEDIIVKVATQTLSDEAEEKQDTPVAEAITIPSGEDSGVFRSTCSSTRARLDSSKENSETVEKSSVKANEELTGVYRSTRSATRARLQSKQEETDIVKDNSEEEGVFRSTRSATRARLKALKNPFDTIDDTKDETTVEDNGSVRSTPSSRRKSLLDAEKAVLDAEASLSANSTANAIDNSLRIDTVPFTEGNDTPSSKGSLQSIWDVLHCGGSENSIDATIVSRVGDCVNPVATTLLKMWREEEKTAVADKEETLASPPSPSSSEDAMSPTLCGMSPPPKSFSTDLNLVYGLERVQNLTLARPKALQATRNMSAALEIVIPPLAPCSQ